MHGYQTEELYSSECLILNNGRTREERMNKLEKDPWTRKYKRWYIDKDKKWNSVQTSTEDFRHDMCNVYISGVSV